MMSTHLRTVDNLTSEQIRALLEEISGVGIAVCGDFCLDVYWRMDPGGGERSVETGLRAEAVSSQYCSPGGAGNIASNLASLNPERISAIGVVGEDLFGRELIQQLENRSIETEHMIVQNENFDTYTYVKRYDDNEEKPRIDLGYFNRKFKQTEQELLTKIEAGLDQCHILIFNQQIPGTLSEHFIAQLQELFDRYWSRKILVDSRDYIDRFTAVSYKVNAKEAARVLGEQIADDTVFHRNAVAEFARELFDMTGKPVFVTRGERGMIAADENGTYHIPGIRPNGKVDAVGAGDTALAAIGLALAADANAAEAMTFGNLSAAVTVNKLYQTGTSTPEEILKVAKTADYIYHPQLAEDPDRALFYNGSEIEICDPAIRGQSPKITHVVFDHDGTISVLRQGWEEVMAEVMVEAILGERSAEVAHSVREEIQQEVGDYIEASAGIQTILQMEALADMVREYGYIEESHIRDKWEYKRIYNEALMQRVKRRTERFRKGERTVQDLTIKGAVDFLEHLATHSVQLYLASGTDRGDVVNEAQLLGYADYFHGGIYGAIGEVEDYSKEQVLRDIFERHNLDGRQLVVIGDGPVEIRAARRVGGISIGIASDEVRRYGLSLRKRTRLIRAGAHFLLPDFTQWPSLTDLLLMD